MYDSPEMLEITTNEISQRLALRYSYISIIAEFISDVYNRIISFIDLVRMAQNTDGMWKLSGIEDNGLWETLDEIQLL